MSIEWAKREYDRVWPFLEPAVDRTEGAHDRKTVWSAIASNKAQLWPGQKSAVVTEVVTHPTGLKSLTYWLAGGDLEELQFMEKQIAEFARSMGCTRVEIYGRRGWLKALTDYQDAGTILTKDL